MRFSRFKAMVRSIAGCRTEVLSHRSLLRYRLRHSHIHVTFFRYLWFEIIELMFYSIDI